ncbi:MAG: transcriptional repressor [Candidatus Omnitrophica bacterium]|nr:transcriptional repressor [Candidatus Omnitrophota bacterium]
MKRNHSIKRDRILELLQTTLEHPTADWIYERLKKEFPDLSLGTVYRNLRILLDEKKIITIRSAAGHDRFDADLSSHQHVVCEKCGKVVDILMNLDKSSLHRLEEKTGFSLASPRISISGLCRDCRLDKSES